MLDNRLRVHTSHETDSDGNRRHGIWVVEVDGRVVHKGSAFSCARYAAEVLRLNPELKQDA